MTPGMASLSDPAVTALLDKPNHAVLSTLNKDGSVHSTMVWLSADGELNKYVNVYLNDEDVRVLEGLDTPVGSFADPLPGPAVTSGDVEAHFVDPDS